MQRCADFWKGSWAALDAKTAGNIRITIESCLSRYENGILRDTLCGETTISPALLFNGAIIVMNFPVQVYGDDGAILQKVFKYMTQREALARNALPQHLRDRPFAIVVDEAQNFLFREAEFMAQSRSSHVSLRLCHAEHPEHHQSYRRRASARSRLRFRVAVRQCGHAQFRLPETNDWFARKLGRTRQSRASYSQSENRSVSHGANMGDGSNWGTSSGTGGSISWNTEQRGATIGSSWNNGKSSGGQESRGRNRGTSTGQGQSYSEQEVLENMIEAGELGRILKTGGPSNQGRVSAIFYSAGRIFKASGTNAVLVEYLQ